MYFNPQSERHLNMTHSSLIWSRSEWEWSCMQVPACIPYKCSFKLGLSNISFSTLRVIKLISIRQSWWSTGSTGSAHTPDLTAQVLRELQLDLHVSKNASRLVTRLPKWVANCFRVSDASHASYSAQTPSILLLIKWLSALNVHSNKRRVTKVF